MNKTRERTLLEIVIVCFWASEYCYGPYFTPYLSGLMISASVIGMIVACYGLTQTIIRIPLGIVTDLTGLYKAVITFGLFCVTVSAVGLYFATNPALLFLFRVLAGIAASTWIASTVVYMAFFSDEENVAASARLNALNNGGKMLAFVLGGMAAVLVGYRASFVMSFVTGLVGFLLVLRLKPVAIRKEPASLSSMLRLMASPRVLIPSLLMAVQMMVLQGTVFSFTSTIAKEKGAGTAMLSVLSVVFTLVQILCVRFIRSPRVVQAPRNRVIAVGFFLLTIYMLLLGFLPNATLLILAQVFAALGSALLTSILLSECVQGVDPAKRSSVVGTYQAIYGIGMTIGPVWMGQMMDRFHSLRACLLFGLAVFLVGAGVFLFYPRKRADVL